MWPYWKSVLGGMVSAVIIEGCYVMYWIYEERKYRERCFQMTKAVTEKMDTHTIIFFPDSRLPCANFFSPKGCHLQKCLYTHEDTSQRQLISFLQMARQRLDVCIYLFTCRDLGKIILELHRRGVQVRIITDRSQSYEDGSQIGTFRAEGIPIRCNSSTFLMHHKFVLLDRKMLINGSFNWTKTATLGNHENILVTNSFHIVQPFIEEFDRLWDMFDPLTEENQKNFLNLKPKRV